MARVALLPEGTRAWLAGAIADGGGELVPVADAEVVVWAEPSQPEALGVVLDEHPSVRWVQLPWAGIEPYLDVVRAHADRTWTAGQGVYAEPVAEMALTLLLAGRRGLAPFARATSWSPPAGENVLGTRIAILGGGGITTALLRLLRPFGAHLTVVRNRAEPLDGADSVVGTDRLDEAITGADALILALALTPETRGIVDRRRLDLLADGAWLVNVARGGHVVTDDLVDALRAGRLGGAGLDVTDPEPLPDGHPLWSLPNVLITPHVGNTPEMAVPLLAARVSENLRRWRDGAALLGVVDPVLGY